MRKGAVSYESLSRCDTYSNPYDARMQARPELIKMRAQQYLDAKDSLASSQQALERELIARILEGNGLFAKGLFPTLGKVAKKLLLAATWPPFFLLVAAPKKLAKKLPILSNKLSTLLSPALLKMKAARTSMVKLFTNKGAKGAARILVQGKRALQSALVPLKKGAMQGKKMAADLATGMRRTLKQIAGKGRGFAPLLQRSKGILQKAARLLPSSAAIKGHKFRGGVSRHLMGVTGRLKQLALPLRHRAGLVAVSARKGVDRARGALAQGQQWAKERVQKVAKPLSSAVASAAKGVAKRASPPLLAVANRLRITAESMARLRERGAKRVDAAVKKGAKSATSLAQELVQWLPTPSVALFLALPNSALGWQRKAAGAVKRRSEKSAKRLMALKRRVAKALQQWRGRQQQLYKKIVEFIGRTTAKATRLVASFKGRVAWLWDFAKKALFTLAFILRMVLAWTRVLIVLTVRLIKECLVELY